MHVTGQDALPDDRQRIIMPGESNNSPRRLVARERQLQALELRKEGFTYDAIAKKLNYNSYQAASAAIEAALKRVLQRPAEEVRKIELERLDMMLRALLPKIRIADWQAINTALRIMDRRAKYLGLDAPVVIEGVIEHIDKRDLSKVPQEDLDRVLAEVNGILHGNDS